MPVSHGWVQCASVYPGITVHSCSVQRCQPETGFPITIATPEVPCTTMQSTHQQTIRCSS
jgi:hypothetical protein